MSQLLKMKIIHVNEVSFVADGLVSALKKRNTDVRFESLYDMRDKVSLPTSYIKRAWRALKLQFKYKDVDIWHVHFMGNALFFLLSTKKLVVHLHGSDIRPPLSLKNRIVKNIIFRRADSILYSTPDIKAYVDTFSEKALYLPNIISEEVLTTPLRQSSDSVKSVFFFAVPNLIKGGDIGLKALEGLKSIYPSLKISVFGFGQCFESRYADKFETLDRMRRGDVLKKVLDSDLVLGQLRVGAIGMSELEVLGLGKPLVTYFKYGEVYQSLMPIYNVSSAEQVIEVMDGVIKEWSEDQENTLSLERRKWVIENHSERVVLDILLGNYVKILGMDKN
ncbi:MAG: hypothetical protein ACLGGX_10845 [Bdellovibrionia bacterium]